MVESNRQKKRQKHEQKWETKRIEGGDTAASQEVRKRREKCEEM